MRGDMVVLRAPLDRPELRYAVLDLTAETGSAADLLISAVDAVVACVLARSPQRSALSH